MEGLENILESIDSSIFSIKDAIDQLDFHPPPEDTLDLKTLYYEAILPAIREKGTIVEVGCSEYFHRRFRFICATTFGTKLDGHR